MADVFLSYKREDQQIAREITADLEAEGFSVFFDVRIDVGDSWDERIERELNTARAAVVLWSPKSRESPWVRREAREAMARKILCPAMVGHCKVPLEFSDVQAANLVGRRAGDLTHDQWRKLCDGVGRCVGRRARGADDNARPASAPQARASAASNRRALIIGAGAAGAAAVGGGGYFGWAQWQAAQAAAQRAQQASAAWAQAQAANTRAAVTAFLRDFPDAAEATEARAILGGLPLVLREGPVLRGHTRAATAVSFSPTGSELATVGSDFAVRLWRVGEAGAEAAHQIAHLTYESPHGGWVSDPSFSSSGARMVAVYSDLSARMFDTASGAAGAIMRGHGRYISAAFFSPDDSRILTSSQDRTARAWDAASGRHLFTMRGHEGLMSMARFSPDGRWIATAAYDYTARIWDAATGQQVHVLRCPAHAVFEVRFTPDSRRILTGDVGAPGDSGARLWDVATGEQIVTFPYEYPIHDVTLSPDGAQVLAKCADNAIVAWNADPSAQNESRLIAPPQNLRLGGINYNPDGTRIIAACENGARIWDVQSGREIAVLYPGEAVNVAAFSPDRRHVLTATANNITRLWQIDEYA